MLVDTSTGKAHTLFYKQASTIFQFHNGFYEGTFRSFFLAVIHQSLARESIAARSGYF